MGGIVGQNKVNTPSDNSLEIISLRKVKLDKYVICVTELQIDFG